MKSDDLIGRSALLERLQGVLDMVKEEPNQTYANAIRGVMRDVKLAPAVDAEPVRHGYWIPQDNTHTKFMCSDCKGRNHDGSEKHCSACGCKMDAEVKHE